MSYQGISGEFWAFAELFLEPFKRKKSGGSNPVAFRMILNGIFYALKTDCQWGYLPRCYSSKPISETMGCRKTRHPDTSTQETTKHGYGNRA
ncbi:MAG: transposase [Methylomonas sp.]|nr:transposase [Methylomonas sp.]PPD20551.1 MAG: hypothetical protein CTY23_08210 [Methylomonas sp.]PPD26565.1 MAG: hypothetical protein CTY22_04765 [Methylomonas sp.]PPD38360.1 MAG: hypothetical protein CTY21_04760 [Methylomonas sp.]PPD42848.1 MAG: hypothetical protein CTY17_00700 [Methylomonas sp.]